MNTSSDWTNETRTKLYCENCMDVLPRLPKVDCLIADIPYGEVNGHRNGLRRMDKGLADEVTFDLKEFLPLVDRLVTGSVYIFCGHQQISPIVSFLRERDYRTRLLTWEKTNPCPLNGQYFWLSGTEMICFGKRAGATYNGHCRSSVLRYPRSGNRSGHPTEKPVALLKDLIETSTNPGDLVLDPCMGSGSTGVAAALANRRFIGVELHPPWYATAVERIRKAEAVLRQQAA